ncbi:MAG: class I SAM-dependent methyltransferase [Bryobacterales bacterium]|nr:class I SAM-dependent methyltransferase [Bryobacterales bacterium]
MARPIGILAVCFALQFSCSPSKSPQLPSGVAVPFLDDPGVSSVEVGNPVFEKRLVRGFYWAHQEAWRWTAPEFAVSLDTPAVGEPVFLELRAHAPDEYISQVGQATLTATVNGVEVGKHDCAGKGDVQRVWPVPERALTRSPVEVAFRLDKAAQARNGTPERMPAGQPFGLIVVDIKLRVDEEKSLSPATAVKMARQDYRRLIAERRLKMSDEKRRELQRLFHDLPVWSHTWFDNMRIEKTPLDLWMVRQVLYEVRPEMIVETGTWRGGSALYWAQTLDSLGLHNSRVVTVDLQNITANAASHPLWKKYVRFLQGSSTDQTIVAKIAAMTAGRRTVVMLDSDHSMKHVLDELHAYAPMVSSGSYLIVEDTHLDGVPTNPGFGPGPTAAVKAFLAEPASRDFFVDEDREAMIITFNPGGWLRKR